MLANAIMMVQDKNMDVEEVEGLIGSEKAAFTTRGAEHDAARRRRMGLAACCSCFVLMLLGGMGSLILVNRMGLSHLFSTNEPTAAPSAMPSTLSPTSIKITEQPSQQPTQDPTAQPSPRPSQQPSHQPIVPKNTHQPSQQPSQQATIQTTDQPTQLQPEKGTDAGADAEDIDNLDIDWGPSHYTSSSSSVVYRPLTEAESDLWANTMHWNKLQPIERPESPSDFGANFPNHDVPMSEFPRNSWQLNGTYLEPWMAEMDLLIVRAVNAILIEYGKNGVNVPFHMDARVEELFVFSITKEGEGPYRTKRGPDQGGWMNARHYRGLTRRLLHALVTGDSLHVVMAGGAAAAGKGNMFQQSLAMQFHKIMEPVLAFMGVELVTQNLAHELGTLPAALGYSDLYGDPDIVLWDGNVADLAALDLFLRQALLSGTKVPFLFLNQVEWQSEIFQKLVPYADVYFMGAGTSKLDECNGCDCNNVPWAARYLKKCPRGCDAKCSEQKWRSNCWVNRSDVKPRVHQEEHPVRDNSLPGFRSHQISARLMTIVVLRALQKAERTWGEAARVEKGNYTGRLADEEWHVTSHYEEIRQHLLQMDDDQSECLKSGSWPSRMCSIPVRSRTEFTPRANPEQTSITSILKPDENGRIPHVSQGMLYSGPNVPNPVTAVPDGETDVLAIISNGRVFDHQRRLDNISPGLGAEVSGNSVAGYCDGTYNAECGRRGSCLLSGHQYSTGGILFRSYSGWLVMTLPTVQQGLIVTKIESRHDPSDKATKEDVGGRSLREEYAYIDADNDENTDKRQLGRVLEVCDAFTFEFSIDGNITTWNKTDWNSFSKQAQSGVELQTLLDDQNFTEEGRDVELAIRFTGCGDVMTMSLTHIYFA